MSVPSEFLNSLFIRKSLFLAGNSLLVHDYLLTFSREVCTSLAMSRMLSKYKRFKVEYVWKAPWTIVKATFLINRYGNLIGQSAIALEEMGVLSHGSQESMIQFCVTFNLVAGIFMIISTESIHRYLRNVQNVVLVLMRAWAIWGCTYRVAVWLILLYVLYVLVVIGMLAYIATAENYVEFQYLDETGVCITPVSPLAPSQVLKALSASLSLAPATPSSVAFYIMGLIALQASTYNNLFIIVCCDPVRFSGILIQTGPKKHAWDSRLVLNLRGLQARHYTTRDLSREVNRQMAAMGGTSFWQAVDQWPNGVHEVGHGAQSGVGAVERPDVELKDVCLTRPAAAAALDSR
ncbi:hypothetical protein BU15DRAFT_63437 [Melanogaster broomeanus]|nr:hypothetical protein BU15DRAFT_63437 [Melanogaster broomeanus]